MGEDCGPEPVDDSTDADAPHGQCLSCGYAGPVQASIEVSGRAALVILTLAVLLAVGVVLPAGDRLGLWSAAAVMRAADDAGAIGAPGLVLLASVVGAALVLYWLYRRIFRPRAWRCPHCRMRVATTAGE